jgi:hypothetical protein
MGDRYRGIEGVEVVEVVGCTLPRVFLLKSPETINSKGFGKSVACKECASS